MYSIYILISFSAQTLDQYDIDRLHAKEKGIPHTFQNTSMASRIKEALRRKG